MEPIVPTPRTTLSRRPQRGTYDRAIVSAILDEALVCHVGFVSEARPFVLPTAHARVDERLYLHGSVASRMLKTLAEGLPVCVTVTLVDGVVLARSAFHHSMNYRSVVVLGTAREVVDLAEKRAALDAIVDHVAPGRSRTVRPPTDPELRATLVLSLPITEASAKIRTGPPVDLEDDYALPGWAGVVPLRLTAGEPVPCPRLGAGVPAPDGVRRYRRG